MDDNYKNFMKDFCFDLLEEFEKSKNYKTEFENGVHFQLWSVLNYIKNRSEAFELDQEYFGIDKFDPEVELGNSKGLSNKEGDAPK